MKKILNLFIVMMITFTSICTINEIFAQSGDLHIDRTNQAEYFVNNTNDGIYGNQWWWGVAKIGGRVAYCIDPVAHTNEGATYKDGKFLDSLPKNQVDRMWLIANYGYGFENDKKVERYLAAQELIWEQMQMSQLYSYGKAVKFDIHYQKVMGSTSLDKIEEYKNTINTLIKNHEKVPSFDKTLYEVEIGETVTLNDKNKVLKYYDVSLPKGMELVSNENNTLKVKIVSKEVDGKEISFQKKTYLSDNATVVWERGDDQKLMTAGNDRYKAFKTSVPFEIKSGDLLIKKVDEDGNKVPNTSFELSYKEDMQDLIGTYTTSNEGTVLINGLDTTTVYIKEIATADNLVLDQNIKKIDIMPAQTVSIEFVNMKKRGSLELAKEDDEGTLVPNTSFKISYDQNMNNPIGIYKTDQSGKVRIDNLEAKEVYIQETEVPSHLILDSSIKKVVVKYNDLTTFKATNNWKKGHIKVIKKDKQSGKVIVAANTSFNVHNQNGQIIQTIKTDSNGEAKLLNMKYGDYYLTEKAAPSKYLYSDKQIKYQIREDGKTYVAEFYNDRVLGKVQLIKEDTITGKIVQGEGSLEGARYGLYARKNILDPADNSVIYKAGEKIKELLTDKDGNAKLDNLYLGDYYFKEIKPSHGYTLDNNEYDFSLSYENQSQAIIKKDVKVKERVISQAFSIIKISDNGTGEVTNLKGVQFTIKSKKDIDKYGSFEKAPIAKNAKGVETKIMETDENGYALSDELPFGEYVVRETKVPYGHLAIADFTVKIDEDSRNPKVWRIFNDEKFKAVLKIVKKDKESGKVINRAGASFKIKNLDNDQYVSYFKWSPFPHVVDEWKSDDSGTVILDEALDAGNYALIETKAPEGYLINPNPIEFKIDNNQAYEILPDLTTPLFEVEMSDESVKGQINIYKYGEVLEDYIDGQFIYKEKKISGMKGEIYAKEDIKDPCNDGNILYPKGSLVDEFEVDETGLASSKPLPLGKYEVVEKVAPVNMVKSDKRYEVNLEYENQNVELVSEKVDINNLRQKINIKVIKKDEIQEVIEGTVFGLYNSEDILVDDKVILKADSLIEELVTDKDGTAYNQKDLALGNYYLKELKASEGYIIDDKRYDIDASYNPAYESLNFEIEHLNQLREIDLYLNKVSNRNHNIKLNGAIFNIYTLNGDEKELIDTFVSGGIYLKGKGKTYEISEDPSFEKTNKYELKEDYYIVDNLKEGTYYYRELGQEEYQTIKVANGLIHVPKLKYFSKILLEEVKAPSGYQLNDKEIMVDIVSEENNINIDLPNEAKIIIPDTNIININFLYALLIILIGGISLISFLFYRLNKGQKGK